MSTSMPPFVAHQFSRDKQQVLPSLWPNLSRVLCARPYVYSDLLEQAGSGDLQRGRGRSVCLAIAPGALHPGWLNASAGICLCPSILRCFYFVANATSCVADGNYSLIRNLRREVAVCPYTCGLFKTPPIYTPYCIPRLSAILKLSNPSVNLNCPSLQPTWCLACNSCINTISSTAICAQAIFS